MANYDTTLSLNPPIPQAAPKPKRGRPPKNQPPANLGNPQGAFICDYCDRSGRVCSRAFGRKSDMTRHRNVHTGERPHPCSYPGCTKAFIQTSALTVHLRVHTGEKPHECPEIGCDKKFSDSSSLARHRKIHKKPFQCAFGNCTRGHNAFDRLHDHVSRNHKGLQYMMQDLRQLVNVHNLFGYKRIAEERIFAVPLRVIKASDSQFYLEQDPDRCLEQNRGGPDSWTVRNEPPQDNTYYSLAACVDNPNAFTAASYSQSNVFQGASMPTVTPSLQPGWEFSSPLSGIVNPGQFQGVPIHTGQTHGLSLTAGYPLQTTASQTYMPIPSVSPYVNYGANLDATALAIFGQASVAANLGAPATMGPPQHGSAQHMQSLDGSVGSAFGQGNSSFVQSALVQQPVDRFEEQRRISGSSATTAYSNSNKYQEGGHQHFGNNQAFVEQVPPSNNAIEQSSEDETYEDSHESYGDGSNTDVPDLEFDEAGSPEEVEVDNCTLHLDIYGYKPDEADTNGHALPSQHHN